MSAIAAISLGFVVGAVTVFALLTGRAIWRLEERVRRLEYEALPEDERGMYTERKLTP